MRGPLVGNLPSEDAAAVSARLIRELKRFAKKQGLILLVADLPYRGGQLVEAMLGLGFIRHLPRLPPVGTMQGALLIDLQQTEADLWQQCRRTLRQNIQRAEKRGVVVRPGGEGDIEILWNLLQELCKRRHARSNVSSVEVLRRIWRTLAPDGLVRIDVAEVEGKPVVALMTVIVGRCVIPWRIGWSGEAKEMHPEKLLYWRLLRDVCNRQYTTFDFNWVDPGEADAILAGRDYPRTENSGITFFKLGFGGQVVRLPGTFDYFPNPILRVVAGTIGKPFLESRLVGRCVSRLRSVGSYRARLA